MDRRRGEDSTYQQDNRQAYQRQPQRPDSNSKPHMNASLNGRKKSCRQQMVNGFLSGSLFGASWSGVSAMARTTQLQVRIVLTTWGFGVRAVVGSTIAGGFAFGSALGIYRGFVCALEEARGIQDIKNSMIAGGLVGFLSEVPVFIRSRIITTSDLLLARQGMHVFKARPKFITNAAAGSILCGIVYMVEIGMRPSHQPLPQGSPGSSPGSLQAPQAHTQDNYEGEDTTATGLDSWSSSETSDSGSDWVVGDSPSGEVIESEVVGWGTK